jgi:hypothetical protein
MEERLFDDYICVCVCVCVCKRDRRLAVVTAVLDEEAHEAGPSTCCPPAQTVVDPLGFASKSVLLFKDKCRRETDHRARYLPLPSPTPSAP